MTIKILKQKIKNKSELRRIEKLLQGMIGEICWGTRLGYGNEFELEIGDKVPSPVIKDKEIGLWRLGGRASKWVLESMGVRVITSEDDLMLIRQNIKLIDGNRIVALKIYWPTLKLEILFDNQMKLKIFPVWYDGSKLAHWEFFMPNSMFLKVGPKLTWSYYRSDIPIP